MVSCDHMSLVSFETGPGETAGPGANGRRAQVKGRMIGFGVQTTAHKEVLAILTTDFFPGGCLWLAQYGSDPLLSQRGTPTDGLAGAL
jgi:hypothetical protein